MKPKSPIRLYNTLSRQIEDFEPLEENKVGIYVCGPTVYDYTHIGHIRKYIFDDVLIRMLRYLAYDVIHVMNVTDVGHLTSEADTGEDKVQEKAKKEGKSAWEVAKFYEDYFFQTMDAVLVKKPDIVCRATEHIKDQIELIQKLEAKGYTYKIDDGIYFDSSKYADYGKLAKLNIADLKPQARVEKVPGKKHSIDFALWKFSYPQGRPFDPTKDDKDKKRHMEWDSPWGLGFPGWHIECSAMSMKYLGESFDIHTGGIDHIPVHHPNEIAQSEVASGKPFVKYWMHHNFLLVEGKKMSKSLGNIFTLDDVKKRGFVPLALRYLLLQTHYRQESNFTWDALKAAQKAHNQLLDQTALLMRKKSIRERSALSDEKLDKVNMLRKRFKDIIRTDLNTAQALACVWETIKTNIPPGDKLDILMIQDEILGLGLKNVNEADVTVEIPENVTKLLAQREKLRQEKKWAESDQLRVQIEKLGYDIEDTPQGTKLKKKSDWLAS